MSQFPSERSGTRLLLRRTFLNTPFRTFLCLLSKSPSSGPFSFRRVSLSNLKDLQCLILELSPNFSQVRMTLCSLSLEFGSAPCLSQRSSVYKFQTPLRRSRSERFREAQPEIVVLAARALRGLGVASDFHDAVAADHDLSVCFERFAFF